MQNETAPLEGSLAVSFKLNITLPYKLATMHIGIYSTDFTSNVSAKICTPMFIEAYYHSDANNRVHWVQGRWEFCNILETFCKFTTM